MTQMVTMDELVKEIARATGIDVARLSARSSLSDLGLSSYAMMRLLIHLEDHFDCELTPDDLAQVFTMTVLQIRDALERSTAAMP